MWADKKQADYVIHSDTGTAARFFYCAKSSAAEREEGLEAFPILSGGELTDRVDGSAGLNSPRAGAGRSGGRRNAHPTVKPIDLMRYLCRLVTPPGGTVLDPFAGSGSTLIAAYREGFASIGIERDKDYFGMATERVKNATAQMRLAL
jgi:site-specific DNA-methyltransferase (adenine-specific)